MRKGRWAVAEAREAVEWLMIELQGPERVWGGWRGDR